MQNLLFSIFNSRFEVTKILVCSILFYTLRSSRQELRKTIELNYKIIVNKLLITELRTDSAEVS